MHQPDRSAERAAMVEQQLAARGIRDPLVLAAMRSVPREAFVRKKLRKFAYDDNPLPIDAEQTISQPYIVALMIEALGLVGGEKVLEIGTGSGYAAAVMGEIAGQVYTVERIEQLAESATATLENQQRKNVHVLIGDGTGGWPEHAPYDAIVVAAGGKQVPEALKEQLRVGGCLVIPVGVDADHQRLLRLQRRSQTEFDTEEIANVRFVPLIGAD